MLWLVIFFPSTVLSICIFGINCPPNQEIRPFPNHHNETWFLPRAATYLSNYFNTREPNKTIIIWPEEREGDKDWKEMFPEMREIYNEEGRTFSIENDTKWEEVLTKSWDYDRKDDRSFRKTINFNSVFRKTERIIRCPKKRARIVQIYVDVGAPLEIPCYICENETGLVNSFHLLPKRDFYNRPFEERKERFPNESESLTYQIPISSSIFSSLHGALKTFQRGSILAQAIRRDVGGQIREEQGVFSQGTGRLQIDPSLEFVERRITGNEQLELIQKTQAIHHGASFECIQYKANSTKPKASTNVVVNVDSLVREDNFSLPAWNIYENWNDNWNLTNLTFPTQNLKIDISWNPWSCCSACCCSLKMCGERATEKKCHLIYSIKTRIGRLVLKKLDQKKEVYFGPSFADGNYLNEQDHLEKIFNVQPYREEGIPLFSTIIPQVLRKEIHDNFTSKFVEIRKANTSDYRGVGLFIQKKSCQNEKEKLDCALWAKCRGMNGYSEMKKDEKETEASLDPCIGLSFKPLIIDSTSTNFKVEEGHSYRLIVDESEFYVGNELKWEIQLKSVDKYDYTKDCDKQKQAIHPNGHDLLLTDLEKKDLEVKITVFLKTGEVLSIKFNDIHEGELDVKSISNVLIWGGAICGIIIILVSFTVLMHQMRLSRVNKSLSKKRNEMKDDQREEDSTPK